MCTQQKLPRSPRKSITLNVYVRSCVRVSVCMYNARGGHIRCDVRRWTFCPAAEHMSSFVVYLGSSRSPVGTLFFTHISLNEPSNGSGQYNLNETWSSERRCSSIAYRSLSRKNKQSQNRMRIELFCVRSVWSILSCSLPCVFSDSYVRITLLFTCLIAYIAHTHIYIFIA